MGGGMADKNRANSAGNGAEASAAASADLSRQNQAQSSSIFNKTWGDPNSVQSQFLKGDQLGKVAPEGVYRLGMDQANKLGERELNNATGSGVAEIANRGFGMDAGAALENFRKNAIAKAGMKAGAFADSAAAQHGEALNNFWNATQASGSQASDARGAAISGAGNAGQTYANVYGNAAQYHQGAAAGIIGAGLQAGGAVGAAAAGNECPAEDSLITLEGDEDVKVQDLDEDFKCKQLGKGYSSMQKPRRTKAQCLRIIADNGKHTIVSWSHTFCTPDGGYVLASDCLGARVKYRDTIVKITRAVDAGILPIYAMSVGGNHSYMCDGFWSLE